jgi:hypothetical protein
MCFCSNANVDMCYCVGVMLVSMLHVRAVLFYSRSSVSSVCVSCVCVCECVCVRVRGRVCV